MSERAGPVSRRKFLIAGGVAAGMAACAQSSVSGPTARVRPTLVPGQGPSFDVARNPYLEGNFAPVTMEVDGIDLPVRGRIPRELRGRLLRVGPNPIAARPAKYHWFFGDGMVHAIELRDGHAVSYRNRWVRTDQAARQLGEQPPPGQAPEVNGRAGNAANTHVVAHAGRVLALYEVALPTQITPGLATIGRYDFAGSLRSPMTAHPKIDPSTGELLFFGLDIFGPPYLRFHVADADGKLVRTQELVLPGPSMMHDFAITERHVVFLDLPVVYDLGLLGKRPFPAAWKPEYGARVGVMSRDGTSNVRWFDVELGYVFHTLNAYDEPERVVLDVIRHARMFDKDIYGVNDAPGLLYRWTINLRTGRVSEVRLDDRHQELPRVDARVIGRRHRYAYNNLFSQGDRPFTAGGLIKHDLHTGRAVEARLGPGAASSEAIFVPAHHDAGEDEGWILAVVYDPTRDGSDLVILDATDFAGRPVARVRLPQRVPFGFHGTWIPETH